MKTCHACKKELVQGRTIGRRDVCPHCRADLTCCLNCSFYDRAASKQCREPMAELVKDKARANFCDYFVFAEARGAAGAAVDAEGTRRALDELFKK
jgi:hypothetical protein